VASPTSGVKWTEIVTPNEVRVGTVREEQEDYLIMTLREGNDRRERGNKT
jgi:hypothetical protein